MRSFETVADFAAEKGKKIGTSDWLLIDQDMIDKFADATGGRNWIHNEPARTQAELGTPPLAQGLLTYTLISSMLSDIYEIKSMVRGLDYGANNLRFTNAVYANSRVRAHLTLKDAQPKAGGMQINNEVSVEIEGQERPAIVAEVLRMVFE